MIFRNGDTNGPRSARAAASSGQEKALLVDPEQGRYHPEPGAPRKGSNRHPQAQGIAHEKQNQHT